MKPMKVRVPDSLGLPAQPKVEAELVRLLASRSQPSPTAEAYDILAKIFGLSSEQRVARFEGARDPAWNWLVRRTMQHLEDAGWAYRPQRGLWIATSAGRYGATGTSHGERET